MKTAQIKLEVTHIFDSGANEFRVIELIERIASQFRSDNEELREELAERDKEVQRLKQENEDYRLSIHEVNHKHNEINERSQKLYEALKIMQGVTDGDFISSTTRRQVCEKAIKIYESTQPGDASKIEECTCRNDSMENVCSGPCTKYPNRSFGPIELNCNNKPGNTGVKQG